MQRAARFHTTWEDVLRETIRPGDGAYDAALAGFGGAHTQGPAAIAYPENEIEVAGYAWAAQHAGLRVVVERDVETATARASLCDALLLRTAALAVGAPPRA